MAAPSKDGFLPPRDVRSVLGISRTYLEKLRKTGKLQTVKDEHGVHQFSRAEVLALARRRHVKVDKVAASIAVQVFEFFRDGYELPEIVMQTGQSPETIRGLYREYKTPLNGETAKERGERLRREEQADREKSRELDRELEARLERTGKAKP